VILILMTARSGSSLVARIFAEHGFDPGPEPVFSCGYQTYENAAVWRFIEKYKRRMPLPGTGRPCEFMPGIEAAIPEPASNALVKVAMEYVTLFKHLEPRVITVKRDAEAIAASMCAKRTPPEPPDRCIGAVHSRLRGLDAMRERWDGAEVNTDEIMAGDFSSVEAAFDHHGIPYDEDVARACVEPDKWHRW